MRRCLTLLLMVLLPLQFSWGGAAAYCGHEGQASAWHVGHHAHEHVAAQGGQDPAQPDEAARHTGDGLASKLAKKPASLLGDNDCGYCHLSLAMPLIAQAVELPPQVGAALLAAQLPALKSRGPDRRERPNWRLA